MPKCHKFYRKCQWTVTHCWPDMALDIVFSLECTGVVQHASSVCVLHLYINLHFKRISSAKVTFRSTLTLLPWQAFTNLCVTILLNNSIQLYMNFVLLYYLHFLLSQQFQPFYPKQRIVISMSFKFLQCVPFNKFWNVQSQYNRTLTTQRTSIVRRRLSRRGG